MRSAVRTLENRCEISSTERAAASYRRTRRALELGARIRALREARGLSQTELAKRMGTSQPAIARLEAGRVTPGLDTLDRVADALNVELAVTFHDTPARAQAPAPGDPSSQRSRQAPA